MLPHLTFLLLYGNGCSMVQLLKYCGLDGGCSVVKFVVGLCDLEGTRPIFFPFVLYSSQTDCFVIFVSMSVLWSVRVSCL